MSSYLLFIEVLRGGGKLISYKGEVQLKLASSELGLQPLIVLNFKSFD